MNNDVESLEFVGLRKWSLYFMFGLSVICVFSAVIMLVVELFTSGAITSENLFFIFSSNEDTLFEVIFGKKPYGTVVTFFAAVTSLSWLLSSFLWVFLFFSWKEIKKGNYKKEEQVLHLSSGILMIEIISILSWAFPADLYSYIVGFILLFLSIIVCWPIVKKYYPILINT